MNDVAIIGVGLHPFGRFDKTCMQMGAEAIQAALVHATSAPLEEDASPTVYAAKAAYEAAGIGPEDVDVAQLQDTDAGAELIHMAETGLCADGEQQKLVADGATELDGPTPV